MLKINNIKHIATAVIIYTLVYGVKSLHTKLNVPTISWKGGTIIVIFQPINMTPTVCFHYNTTRA